MSDSVHPEGSRARGNYHEFDAAAKETVLAWLRKGYSVAYAARQAGFSRTTVFRHRQVDEDFAAAYADAYEEGSDALEDEARRRAEDGVEEPVYYQGDKIDTIRRYDSSLLMFLLKARRPEKYRERREVLTGEDSSLAERIASARKRERATSGEPITADDPLLG